MCVCVWVCVCVCDTVLSSSWSENDVKANNSFFLLLQGASLVMLYCDLHRYAKSRQYLYSPIDAIRWPWILVSMKSSFATWAMKAFVFALSALSCGNVWYANNMWLSCLIWWFITVVLSSWKQGRRHFLSKHSIWTGSPVGSFLLLWHWMWWKHFKQLKNGYL